MRTEDFGILLLSALARRLTTGAVTPPGTQGAPLLSEANVTFAAAGDLLEELGLAQRAKGGSRHLCLDAQEIGQTICITPDGPVWTRLVHTFLSVACQYDGLSARRSWFRPPLPYTRILDHFVAHGLAQAHLDLCRWDASVAPHMIDAGLWSGTAAPADAPARARLRAEATQALETLPVFLRRRFFGKPELDMIGLISVISHAWDGTAWRPFTKTRRFLDVPQARALAEEIAAQADLRWRARDKRR